MERVDNSGDPVQAREDLEESLNKDIPKILAYDAWVDDEYDADEEARYLKDNYPHIYEDFKRRDVL